MGVLSGHPLFGVGYEPTSCGVKVRQTPPARCHRRQCGMFMAVVVAPGTPSSDVYRGVVQLVPMQCDKIEWDNQAGHVR